MEGYRGREGEREGGRREGGWVSTGPCSDWKLSEELENVEHCGGIMTVFAIRTTSTILHTPQPSRYYMTCFQPTSFQPYEYQQWDGIILTTNH